MFAPTPVRHRVVPGRLYSLRGLIRANTTNLAIDLAAPECGLDHVEQGIGEALALPHPSAGFLSGRADIPAKREGPLVSHLLGGSPERPSTHAAPPSFKEDTFGCIENIVLMSRGVSSPHSTLGPSQASAMPVGKWRRQNATRGLRGARDCLRHRRRSQKLSEPKDPSSLRSVRQSSETEHF